MANERLSVKENEVVSQLLGYWRTLRNQSQADTAPYLKMAFSSYSQLELNTDGNIRVGLLPIIAGYLEYPEEEFPGVIKDIIEKVIDKEDKIGEKLLPSNDTFTLPSRNREGHVWWRRAYRLQFDSSYHSPKYPIPARIDTPKLPYVEIYLAYTDLPTLLESGKLSQIGELATIPYRALLGHWLKTNRVQMKDLQDGLLGPPVWAIKPD